MNTDKLKEKILQLTIQGKENCDFKKYNIGDLLKRVKNPIEIEDDVEYKRVTIKLKNKGIVLRDVKKGKDIGTKRQFLIQKGFFVLSKIDARNGAFGIVPDTLDGAIFTGNFWGYKVDEEKLNIKWFNLFVSSQIFIKICETSSSGTTNRKYLNEKNFLNFEISLPPLEEQKRIVAKVEELFTIIDSLNENKEDMLKNISDTRSKILQLAIQGKLVEQNEGDTPASVLLEEIKKEKEELIKEKKIKKEKALPEITEEEKPFVLPIEWKYARLNDIVTFENGDRSSKYPSPSEIVNDGIPFINTTNINGDYLNLKKEQLRFITNEKFESLKSGKLKDCDFVVTLRGSIGKVAQFIPNNKYDTGFINAQLLIMRLLNIEISAYMKYFYKSEMFVQQVNEMSTGSAQPQLSAGKVKEIIIPLPPLEEQRRIVAKVEELMSYLDELENLLKVSVIPPLQGKA